jgi:hypothetical protein
MAEHGKPIFPFPARGGPIDRLRRAPFLIRFLHAVLNIYNDTEIGGRVISFVESPLRTLMANAKMLIIAGWFDKPEESLGMGECDCAKIKFCLTASDVQLKKVPGLTDEAVHAAEQYLLTEIRRELRDYFSEEGCIGVGTLPSPTPDCKLECVPLKGLDEQSTLTFEMEIRAAGSAPGSGSKFTATITVSARIEGEAFRKRAALRVPPGTTEPSDPLPAPPTRPPPAITPASLPPRRHRRGDPHGRVPGVLEQHDRDSIGCVSCEGLRPDGP